MKRKQKNTNENIKCFDNNCNLKNAKNSVDFSNFKTKQIHFKICIYIHIDICIFVYTVNGSCQN